MPRVLLLEDDARVGRLVRDTLEQDGCAVLWCRTVTEARAAIPPVGFDVLLCDYELPDGTGLDFLADVERASLLPGVEQPSGLGLSRWTTILWSGLDRSREIAASGIKIDHVEFKERLPEVLDLARNAKRKGRQTDG